MVAMLVTTKQWWLCKSLLSNGGYVSHYYAMVAMLVTTKQ